VSNGRVFLKYWLPVLLWMVIIFSASGDTMSFQHSSRILGPLLHWLFPKVSRETLQTFVTIIRKCAHVTEYAALALLFWRAFWKPQKDDSRPWSWRVARNALLCSALYAATDEFHQMFVPTRQGMLTDVLIDITGAALGLLLAWAVRRWLKKW
jgi:VanZ family protein